MNEESTPGKNNNIDLLLPKVQRHPYVVVGAEESQANCWQKATPKVSYFHCFKKFRALQQSGL